MLWNPYCAHKSQRASWALGARTSVRTIWMAPLTWTRTLASKVFILYLARLQPTALTCWFAWASSGYPKRPTAADLHAGLSSWRVTVHNKPSVGVYGGLPLRAKCGHWPSLALRLQQAVASNTTLRYPRSKLTVRLCTGQQADLDAQENFGYQRGHEHRQCIWRPESHAGIMFAVNQAVEFPPRSELKRQAAPGNVRPKPFVKVVGDQSHQRQQQR